MGTPLNTDLGLRRVGDDRRQGRFARARTLGGPDCHTERLSSQEHHGASGLCYVGMDMIMLMFQKVYIFFWQPCRKLIVGNTLKLIWPGFESMFSMIQFSSVTQSCPTLCNPMDCCTPDFPVHHQLLEFTQAHVH